MAKERTAWVVSMVLISSALGIAIAKAQSASKDAAYWKAKYEKSVGIVEVNFETLERAGRLYRLQENDLKKCEARISN